MRQRDGRRDPGDDRHRGRTPVRIPRRRSAGRSPSSDAPSPDTAPVPRAHRRRRRWWRAAPGARCGDARRRCKARPSRPPPARPRRAAGAAAPSSGRRASGGAGAATPTSRRTPRATVRNSWIRRSSGSRPASRSSCIRRWRTVAARPLCTTPCAFIHWLWKLSRLEPRTDARELVGRRFEPEHGVEERQQVGAVVVARRREDTGHHVGRVLHVDEHLEEAGRGRPAHALRHGRLPGLGLAQPLRAPGSGAPGPDTPTPSLWWVIIT